MKGSNLNVAALVRVSMEELGLDADTGEAVVAHTPELVEDSNEAIDAVVEAHGEVAKHHDTIEVMEDLVEKLEEAVKDLEGAQGTVSTESEGVSGEIVNSVLDGEGTVAEGVSAATVVDTVVTGGGEVTPAAADITVNPDVDGIVTDPATIEPAEIEKAAEAAVSLERFRQNCARISNVYRSVGLEALPALPAPEKKNAIIEGAKAKAKGIGAALKKMWDQFVAALKSLWGHIFNAVDHTGKRAAAVKSAAEKMPSEKIGGEVKASFSADEAKKALTKAVSVLSGTASFLAKGGDFGNDESRIIPAVKNVPVYGKIDIAAIAGDVANVCAHIKGAEAAFKTYTDAAEKHIASLSNPEEVAKVKEEMKNGRERIAKVSTYTKYSLTLARATLAAAEKSLRAHGAAKPAETATA